MFSLLKMYKHKYIKRWGNSYWARKSTTPYGYIIWSSKRTFYKHKLNIKTITKEGQYPMCLTVTESAKRCLLPKITLKLRGKVLLKALMLFSTSLGMLGMEHLAGN